MPTWREKNERCEEINRRQERRREEEIRKKKSFSVDFQRPISTNIKQRATPCCIQVEAAFNSQATRAVRKYVSD
jgi:hypothetical protein